MKEKNLDNETLPAQDKSTPRGLHQQNMKTQNTIEALPGDHIEKVCENALELAKSQRRKVSFEFNGKTITINPTDTKRSALLKWNKDYYKNRQKTCLYPKTAKEALRRWDEGRGVFTVEMGGLGPGYEQAIQILVFEIIRDQGKTPLPNPGTAANGWRDDTVSRCNKDCLGFSGAQVGAAKNLAYHYLRDGYEKTLMSFKEKDDGRLTQVSKEFPKAPGVPETQSRTEQGEFLVK